MSGDVNIDIRELERFADKIKDLAFEESIDRFCESCAKELAARLLRMVIKRTPVYRPKYNGAKTIKIKGVSGKVHSFLTADYERYQKYWQGYVGGTLRRGWTASSEREAATGGEKTVDEFVNGIKVEKKGSTYEVSIFNPVSYAKYVEYGHRQTPGRYVPALGKRLKQGWVHGRFMLTLSEEELNLGKDAILEKKLNDFIRQSLSES